MAKTTAPVTARGNEARADDTAAHAPAPSADAPARGQSTITPRVSSMALVASAARAEFSKRLLRAMAEKGMSQSDLARACWGDAPAANGASYPKGRDRISKYCRGEQLPDAEGIASICRVLEMDIADLAPGFYKTKDEVPWTVSMASVASQPGFVALHVDVLVRWADAAEAVRLLEMARDRDATALREGKPPSGPHIELRERDE